MSMLANLVALLSASLFGVALFFGLILWLGATPPGLISWPFLWFTGFLYLWLMALGSFLRYGRRPGGVFGGLWQLGELFEWKYGSYSTQRFLHWKKQPLFYEWWIRVQNPVLLDSLLEEQNKTRFFLWGSFVRYLFLCLFWAGLGIFRQVQRIFFFFSTSEFGQTLLFWFLPLIKYFIQWVTPFFWALHQGWSRFTYALAGETTGSAFFRAFSLDSLVRQQWYYKSNMQINESPLALEQKALSLNLLRWLFYASGRLSEYRRLALPWIFSLVPLVALSLVLGPLALLSILLGSSFVLPYVLLRSSLAHRFFFLQHLALLFLWSLFTFFLWVPRSFPALLGPLIKLLRVFWWFLVSCLPWVLLFTAVLFFFSGQGQSFFRLGFGFLLWDFFYQIWNTFSWSFDRISYVPLGESYLSWYPQLLRELEMEDLSELFGNSHWTGYEARGLPWGFAEDRPMDLVWWDHGASVALWQAPSIRAAYLRTSSDFINYFEDTILEIFETAKKNRHLLWKNQLVWSYFWKEWVYILEFATTAGWYGPYYLLLERYYRWIYKTVGPHYAYYWFHLFRFSLSYRCSVLVSFFSSLSLLWPFQMLFLLLRSLAQQFVVVSRVFQALLSVSSFGVPSSFSLGLYLDQRWGLSSFLWTFPLRWFYWMFSLIFWEWSQISFWLSFGTMFQGGWSYLAHGHWSAVWESFSPASLALGFFLKVQSLLDSVCLYVQFPRNLDDYVLFFKYRRARRTLLFPLEPVTTIYKGTLFTGRQWALSPVILFRYVLSPLYLWDHARFSSYLPERNSFFFLEQARALPWLLADIPRLLVVLGPLFYFVGLVLVVLFFSGTLLWHTDAVFQSPVYRRQWAWEHYRGLQQTHQEIENNFFLPPSTVFTSRGKLRVHGPETPLAQDLFRRLSQLLWNPQKNLPAPEYLQPMSSPNSFLLDQVLRQQVVVVEFGRFLLHPKYKSFHRTLLHSQSTNFVLFLAYFYSKNPWIPLCWNNYSEEDYYCWLSDGSLSLARRLEAQGAHFRRLLDQTNSLLFQDRLGEWLCSKDGGTYPLEAVKKSKNWGYLAYALEDRDQDSYVPWAFSYWFFFFPLYLFLNLSLSLGRPWHEQPLIEGCGHGELLRQAFIDHTILGHFYFFYRQMETFGWFFLPEIDLYDSPVAAWGEATLNGYRWNWDEGYMKAFYPVATKWPYLHRTWAPFVAWRPSPLLEEYGQLSTVAFFLILLASLGAKRGQASNLVLPFQPHWMTAVTYWRQAKTIYLWFWK